MPSHNQSSNRRNNKTQMRTILFSFLIGLGLLSVIAVYYNSIKDKEIKEEPIVLGDITDQSTIETKNMVDYDGFTLPKVFSKDTVKNTDKQIFISSKDGKNKLAHIKGVSMSEEDTKIYTINNLQFYAKFLQEKVFPAVQVASTDNYINLDEFSTKKYTYFALAYDEGDHFKYIIINVYSGKGGAKQVSYTILQFSKENEDLYMADEISVETHKEILTEVFSSFEE